MAELYHARTMRTRATPMGGKDLRRIALLWSYPALRQLPRSGWDEALEHAREMSFDRME